MSCEAESLFIRLLTSVLTPCLRSPSHPSFCLSVCVSVCLPGVYLNAGREHAVASTKAFTTQVTVMTLIALWFR